MNGVLLIYLQATVGTCAGGPVLAEGLAGVVGDDALLVEAVLAMALGAGGDADALAVEAEGIAAQGQGIGVKAVGALAIVGVERGWVIHVAVAHDDAAVEPQVFLALQTVVDGIEYALSEWLPRLLANVKWVAPPWMV